MLSNTSVATNIKSDRGMQRLERGGFPAEGSAIGFAVRTMLQV
jgi:hypothetical protein